MTEEINLVDFIKLLVKNKFIIFLFFLIGVLVSLSINFLTPVIYKAEAVIKIGSLGNKNLIENPEQIASSINFNLLEKYPSVEAVVVPNTELIDIKNYSSNKNQAINSVSDIISEIISEQKKALEVYANEIRAEIKNNDLMAEQLMRSGQQIVILKMRNLDLKLQLDHSVSPQIIKSPVVSEVKKKSIFLNFIIGATLGIFLGVLIIFSKEWWIENKNNLV